MKQTKRVLSVVLALAMVFAMNIMVAAATPEPIFTVTQKDGIVTVTITAKAGENYALIDYGVAYDTSKAEVVMNEDGEVATWGDKVAKYSMKDCGIVDETYVTLGATHKNDVNELADGDVIATIQFKAKDGADAGKFTVVADSASQEFSADGKVNGDDSKAVEPVVVADPTPTPEASVTPEAVSPAPEASAPAGDVDVPTNGGTTNGGTTNGGSDNVPGTNSDAAASKAPAASASAQTTDGNTVKAAKTADTASVVIPVVAICAAAAAVVVASKKRVED